MSTYPNTPAKRGSKPVRRRKTATITENAELLRTGPTAAFLGIGPTQLFLLRRDDPTFPAAIPLGKRAIAFRRSDLIDWIERRRG